MKPAGGRPGLPAPGKSDGGTPQRFPGIITEVIEMRLLLRALGPGGRLVGSVLGPELTCRWDVGSTTSGHCTEGGLGTARTAVGHAQGYGSTIPKDT